MISFGFKSTFLRYFSWYLSYFLFVNKTFHTLMRSFSWWSIVCLQNYNHPKISQNYGFGDMSNFGFYGLLLKLISYYLLLIFLALIICFETNKSTTLYYDQTWICEIMAAQIKLNKIVYIFSIFGSCHWIEFLPWLPIWNTININNIFGASLE